MKESSCAQANVLLDAFVLDAVVAHSGIHWVPMTREGFFSVFGEAGM